MNNVSKLLLRWWSLEYADCTPCGEVSFLIQEKGYSDYGTKLYLVVRFQSTGQCQVTFLLSLSDLLWPRMEVPVRFPSMGPWCNGYRHRIWTRRYEFKSCTRLIAFHIALIPLGKVWIQLFSLQLLLNSRAD